MLLNQRVRGGILLYALFMAAIFSLLLQVYLERMVASQRQNLAQVQASQSRLMAQLTADLADKSSGQLAFSQGQTKYQLEDRQLVVIVESKGQTRTYRFTKQDQK